MDGGGHLEMLGDSGKKQKMTENSGRQRKTAEDSGGQPGTARTPQFHPSLSLRFPDRTNSGKDGLDDRMLSVLILAQECRTFPLQTPGKSHFRHESTPTTFKVVKATPLSFRPLVLQCQHFAKFSNTVFSEDNEDRHVHCGKVQ